jgi:hypothetical protein
MSDERLDHQAGVRMTKTMWNRVVAAANIRNITAMAYMRDAVQKRLDIDDGKLCEKEAEYVTTSNLKEKMEEILDSPRNINLQNTTDIQLLTDLILDALDNPAVIQKLREKLNEQIIDINYQRKG